MREPGVVTPSGPSQLIAFNKPFGVMSQFSVHPSRETLSEFIPRRDVYPAGRLDADSEGLLLLTDDGQLQHRISHPKKKLWKRYWVQVEGTPDRDALETLAAGVEIKGGRTAPCRVRPLAAPSALWPRTPPIRVRQCVPDAWLEIAIREGKNRQIRRMTAAVNLPTLRLVRVAIGGLQLVSGVGQSTLSPGQWAEVKSAQLFS